MTSATASLAPATRTDPRWIHGWMLLIAAAALASGMALAVLSDDSRIATDTAHYMAVATNLLEGQGITTDIVYYEDHHRQGTIPARQTVWPPGYPALIALLGLTGLTVESAAFVVTLLAHVLTPVLLALALLAAGVRRPVAAAAAIACAACALPASYVLARLSEPVFTCLTLASFACVVAHVSRVNARGAWLLGAGAFAALAFVVRYPGVFFIAALGLVFGVRLLRRRDARSLRECVLVLAIPAATALALVLYNLAVTDRLSGNPPTHDGAAPLHLVKFLYWSIAKVFGFAAPVAVSTLVLALLALGTLGVLALVARRVWRPFRSAGEGEAFHVAWSLSLAYGAVTLAGLAYLGATAADWYLSDRYLTQLLPFVLVLVACAATWLLADRRSDERVFRVGGAVAFGLLAAGFLLGQSRVVQAEREWYAADDRYRTMAAALESLHGGQTLLEYLQANVSERTPVLASEAELLGAILDRPVIGLPEDRFTDRTFDTAEVARLVRAYGVRFVLVFPRAHGPGSQVQANQPFMTQLLGRQVPPWLTLVSDQPALQVYSVELR
jgi:hypothetical protein